MKNESRYNLKEKSLIFAISVTIGIFASLVSVLLFALMALMLDLGEGASALFATTSLAIGGFLSAFISSKKLKKKGIINGLICAAITFLLVLIISLIVDKGGITLNTLFNLIATVLSGLIGGISGVGQTKYDRITY